MTENVLHLPPPYSPREEAANVASHALGALLSLLGLVYLVTLACNFGTAWHIIGAGIFGATLVFLYTASSIYHAVSGSRAKHLAKIMDHAGIYMLIAGTYTPFMIVTLRGPWGWSLLTLAWGLAIAGISLEALWVYRPKWLSAAVFLAMGWMILIAGKPLYLALPRPGMTLLIAGGLFYTFGTVFYVMKRVRYHHAVWHLFVLAGSACHFFAIARHVLPQCSTVGAMATH